MKRPVSNQQPQEVTEVYFPPDTLVRDVASVAFALHNTGDCRQTATVRGRGLPTEQ